jgi:hypothetical protein
MATVKMSFAKKNQQLHWTAHSRAKMNFYRLSLGKVKRVINSPERIERGVAPDTIALMQSVNAVKHPYEIWVMIQETATDRKVVSAWRYPGRTKAGEPLPEKILEELGAIL